LEDQAVIHLTEQLAGHRSNAGGSAKAQVDCVVLHQVVPLLQVDGGVAVVAPGHEVHVDPAHDGQEQPQILLFILNESKWATCTSAVPKVMRQPAAQMAIWWCH
jgi:hypothetical protein